MIAEAFNWINALMGSSAFIALCASFAWGALSVILSPCHLTSIPLVIGFLSSQGKISVKKALFLSLIFSVGILINILILGLVTGFLGRALGDIGRFGNSIVSVMFFVFGLYLLDAVSIPLLDNARKPKIFKKGFFSAFFIGVLFGFAVTPFAFIFLAPVLGLVFKSFSQNIVFALLLILSYASGHCLIITLAGTFAKITQNYLKWDAESKAVTVMKRICGILIMLGGVYILLG